MKKKFKLSKYFRFCWKNFCIIFFNQKNMKRDIITLVIFIVLLTRIVFFGGLVNVSKRFGQINDFSKKYSIYFMKINPLAILLEKIQTLKFGQIASESATQPGLSEEQVREEVKVAQESIDTGNWKIYQSQWYGVEFKYPNDWDNPVHKSAGSGIIWEYRSQFRKKNVDADNPYLGFDLVIYSILKIKEATSTDEFPKLKSEELKNNEACATIQGHLIETGDYPAEEIYIPPTDDCYAPVLYFSFVRDAYVYNIVPVMREGYDRASDPMVDVTDHFPEFFSVASEMKITDIVRPKPKPAAVTPRPTGAPMPYMYKKVNGQRVCSSKNDNPSKSKKNKGRHMDMECCLDPDEYPNPNCYYDPKKYGKYM